MNTYSAISSSRVDEVDTEVGSPEMLGTTMRQVSGETGGFDVDGDDGEGDVGLEEYGGLAPIPGTGTLLPQIILPSPPTATAAARSMMHGGATVTVESLMRRKERSHQRTVFIAPDGSTTAKASVTGNHMVTSNVTTGTAGTTTGTTTTTTSPHTAGLGSGGDGKAGGGAEEDDNPLPSTIAKHHNDSSHVKRGVSFHEVDSSASSASLVQRFNSDLSTTFGPSVGGSFRFPRGPNVSSGSHSFFGAGNKNKSGEASAAAAAAALSKRAPLPTAAYGAEKVLLPTAKVLTRAMEKASSRAPPQKANIQESVHLILAKIAIPPSLASGAGSSSMQKQREANTHYMHKEMEHVLQARRSQKEMQEFQAVLEKLEEDATQRRRAHRRLLDSVPLPPGAGGGIGAGAVGLGGTIGPAGAGGPEEQNAMAMDSSTDEDADEEEVVASPRDEREKMRSMATSNALIKRINEREARRWLETQKKVIEDPGGLQILQEELQESSARLRASRISRRSEPGVEGDHRRIAGPLPPPALPASSSAAAAMEKDISWVSLPSETTAGASASRAPPRTGSPNESRSMHDASGTLRHMAGSTATGTGGQSLSMPGRTFSISTTEPTMMGENERSSTAAASAPPASEALLQRLLQRGNGRSIYGLERRGMTQKERAQENERRQHRLQQQAQSMQQQQQQQQQQHSRSKSTETNASATPHGGGSTSMGGMLRDGDDEMDYDEALSVGRDGDTSGGGGGEGEGGEIKPSKTRKEVHFSTGLTENGGGVAGESRSASQLSKEENMSSARSSSSSRSPSSVKPTHPSAVKKRPQRFQVLKKHTEPMPAAPGVGDRSAALMRNSILSLRRRSIAVEMQCGDDVKRTCHCIEQLYPLRVALLDHDLFGVYDVTHPSQWDAKYRRKRQHRSKHHRKAAAGTGDGAEDGPSQKKQKKSKKKGDEEGDNDGGDDEEEEEEEESHAEETDEMTSASKEKLQEATTGSQHHKVNEKRSSGESASGSSGAEEKKAKKAGVPSGSQKHEGESSRASSVSTQAAKGDVGESMGSEKRVKPPSSSSSGSSSPAMGHSNSSPDDDDDEEDVVDTDDEKGSSRRRARRRRELEKKAFVDPGMMLEKHRRIIFDTALRMDDEDRKKACLEYITCLETLSKERISNSTWPSASAAFEHSRDLLLREPNKQNFAGFTSLVNAHFMVEQLVEWPVQEMLRRLAGIFFVSQNQYRDWMAGLYQKMSNTHDYEGRFRAVDCTIKNKEIPTEAHVRITLHRARKLPRIDTLLAVPKISTGASALRRRSPTASDKTRTPSPGLGAIGPSDATLETAVGTGSGAENSDTGVVPPTGLDITSTSSNPGIDLGSPPGSKHGSQPDFNATTNSFLGQRVAPSVALGLEDTLDDKNGDNEKVVHVPEYAVRLTAERQIITSSAVPAGNSNSSGAGGGGDGGGDDGHAGGGGGGGKESDATNTVTARQRVYFYDQTFKLHLYDVASVISVDLLSDGSLVSSGNFSIERYLHWKKTSLWLPLRGKYSRRPTELQLTIEVL